MNFLFLHQNFPAQFRHIAAALAGDVRHTVVGLGESENVKVNPKVHPHLNVFGYPAPPAVNPSTHHYIQPFEHHIRRGQNVIRALNTISQSGFIPDVVVGHSGWGETMFVRDIYPQARIVDYCEFFYQPKGSDVNFDAEFPTQVDDIFRVRVKNSTQWMNLLDCDLGISPTHWQRSTYPSLIQEKIHVIHEGIHTHVVTPNANAHIRVGHQDFKAGDEILTYVARNLEPYRGFHVFMRSLPEILERRPNARVLIVGGDQVSYGAPLPNGQSYKDKYMQALNGRLDTSRVHFLGRVSYADFIKVLQVSAAHVYLTYPFVLSWSMLEAMSAGCLVIGSSTPPVQEVIEHQRNGLLVDFFDSAQLAHTVCEALAHPLRYAALRAQARQTIIERFDLTTHCLPQWINLLENC
jgi:glycosyltransferase involved in cell wall biosynthesis